MRSSICKFDSAIVANMEVPEITFSAERKKPLKIGNQEFFSAIDFSLTEKELEKARKELHETEEIKIKKLQDLREKLARDKDVNYRTDTPYLLRFLRVRKYDSTKAYQHIKEAYTYKKKFPENLYIPQNLEELLNRNIFRYLPYTDENGHILFYIDVGKWNLQETSVRDFVHVIDKECKIISMNPRLQINGCIAIWNAESFSLQHIVSIWSSIGPKAFLIYMLIMFPWRVKNLLVVNAGSFSQLFYKMLRPFLSKKLSDRIILLGSDMKELHKYVNPALLPEKLGGSIDDQYSITQDILENISYIKYDNAFT